MAICKGYKGIEQPRATVGAYMVNIPAEHMGCKEEES
jgi:hypothetical protein